MSRAEEFRSIVVGRLKDAIESRDKTVTGVERELGHGRGFLADALRGDKRLSLEAVLEVLSLLEIDPHHFFAAEGTGPAIWYPGNEISEGRAVPTGDQAPVACPCVHLSRRLDLLVSALEERDLLDARTASVLREE